jgi:hypothetical protein
MSASPVFFFCNNAGHDFMGGCTLYEIFIFIFSATFSETFPSG